MPLIEPVRIIGIDPGYRVTGWGVIDTNGSITRYVNSGTIATDPSGDIAARLNAIFSGVADLLVRFKPDQMAIERVFVNRNVDSALKLGQARAAAICATFPERIEVAEYAPRAIKQALVGRGGAEKEQVQHMVRALLDINERLPADAADALAIAVCHANTRPLAQQLAEASS